MFTPRSARAKKHLPRAPGLSSIVTVNSFAFAMRLDSLPYPGHRKPLSVSISRVQEIGRNFSLKTMRILSHTSVFVRVVASRCKMRVGGRDPQVQSKRLILRIRTWEGFPLLHSRSQQRAIPQHPAIPPLTLGWSPARKRSQCLVAPPLKFGDRLVE